jgi:poly(3-hydroxybutyrate) depolymerase
MAAGGTKKFLYMRYPGPQGSNWATLKANLDVLMPEVEKICEASTDPKCLWVDLRPVWEGHYSQYTSDGIHCTSSGGTATAEALWKAIKESNFFDTTEQPFDGNILVGGKTRTFIVHAPPVLPANPALVISMHGIGGSGSLQRSLSGFDKVADKGKFIVVYPNGVDRSAGGNGWDISGNSDVDFISALIDTMSGRYRINSKRVYATGFSMGGMMSYKLACAMADKIAAIGSASGYPLSDMAPDNCSPARPVPICHIHGMSDDVVPYSGLEAYVAKFVKSNGCPGTPTVNNYSSSKYIKEYWGPCKEGSEIIVYHVDGMSNDYPASASQGFSASDTFWAFFSRHPGPTGVANASTARPAQFIFAGYSAGKIHLQGDRDISAVRVFDVRGKAIFSWKAAVSPVHDLAFPVNHAAGGIYLVNIAGAAGNSVIRVLIP